MSQETAPPPAIRKAWKQSGFVDLEHVLFMDATRGIQTACGEIIIKDLGHAFFSGMTKKGKGIIISVWNVQMTRNCAMVIFPRLGRSARVLQSIWIDHPPPIGVTRTAKN